MPVPAARRAALRRRLLAWYDAGRRDLPWRFPQHGADPYRVWLAEVMLQQTQVATAIPYYQRFVARFPTLDALAEAREDDVLALWGGLGYYARARNLLAAAREAVRRHGGLPRTVEALRELPGFGPYTAGAVASIAFALPAPAVDGNVTRVLARLFLVEGDPAAPGTRKRLGGLAAALVPGDRPGDWNQALMELGATVCRSPSPACARCPVARLCAGRAAGRASELPPPRRRPARRAVRLACALAERDGAILLVRRPRGGLLGGLWDLPAVEVSAPGGASRALATRLGPGARVAPAVAEVTRVLTHRTLTLSAHPAVLPAGRAPEGARWTAAAELDGLGLSAATRALLAAARDRAPRVRAGTPARGR